MLLQFRWIKTASGALDPDFARGLAHQFGLRTFIETGTYRGDTLASLVPVFDRLLSIEIEPALARSAKARFEHDAKIIILESDSASGLRDALRSAGDGPALIWLDAHYSGGETGRGVLNTPILEEIDAIVDHGDSGHVLLMDDLRYFWPSAPGFLDHEALAGYPTIGRVIDRLNRGRARYDCFALGDALLAIPASERSRYAVSPVLAACTRSRFLDRPTRLEMEFESVIQGAEGDERAAIADLPDFIVSQSAYGLGGHYFYWRSLLNARHTGWSPSADQDLALAIKCRVIPA